MPPTCSCYPPFEQNTTDFWGLPTASVRLRASPLSLGGLNSSIDKVLRGSIMLSHDSNLGDLVASDKSSGALTMGKRARHETNLSTKESEAAADPWVQGAHADERGQEHSQKETGERQESAGRVGSQPRRVAEGPAPKDARRCKRYGFGRDARITRKREYVKIYERGKRYDKEWMTIFILPREDDRIRAGLAVSRRIGGAVTRNRVKRLLREAIRVNRERLGFGADIVVVAKPGIGELSYHQVEKLVIRYFEELRKGFAPHPLRL